MLPCSVFSYWLCCWLLSVTLGELPVIKGLLTAQGQCSGQGFQDSVQDRDFRTVFRTRISPYKDRLCREDFFLTG